MSYQPQSAVACYKLGLLLAEDPNRVTEAELAFRKAIELDPGNARYFYRLGLFLQENVHRFVEAERAYRRAIDLAPEDAFLYGGLISLLVQQSRRPEALAMSTRMRAMLVDSQNWYGLAALDAILGDTESAIGHLEQAARQENFNRQWARDDPDLASIRDDPRFEAIVSVQGTKGD